MVEYKVLKVIKPDMFNEKVVTEKVEKERKKKVANKLVKLTSKKLLSKKILKKPKAKLPSYSPTKFVSALANNPGALVREVPNPYADPVQDNRSLYFKDEWIKAKKKAFGGFL